MPFNALEIFFFDWFLVDQSGEEKFIPYALKCALIYFDRFPHHTEVSLTLVFVEANSYIIFTHYTFASGDYYERQCCNETLRNTVINLQNVQFLRFFFTEKVD